jgi:hypothetical protein
MIDPERVEALLARCEKEDNNPPSHRFLYTAEIRRILGVEPQDPDHYRDLAQAIDAELKGGQR